MGFGGLSHTEEGDEDEGRLARLARVASAAKEVARVRAEGDLVVGHSQARSALDALDDALDDLLPGDVL